MQHSMMLKIIDDPTILTQPLKQKVMACPLTLQQQWTISRLPLCAASCLLWTFLDLLALQKQLGGYQCCREFPGTTADGAECHGHRTCYVWR